MTPLAVVLDTDTLSYLVERDHAVGERFRQTLAGGTVIYLCPVVRYEVLRGLLRRNAPAKAARFGQFVRVLREDALDAADWDLAARLWANSVGTGRPADDADILIAAFAINRNATLVTNNARHFEHLPVAIESWLEPPPAQVPASED